MSEETSPPEFKVFWTWSSPKNGWLSTLIRSDGYVRQIRQYSPTTEAAADSLGNVPASRARKIYDLASAVFETEAAAHSAPDDPAPEVESVELSVFDATGDRTVRVPFTELGRHPGMSRVRNAVIAARNRTNPWAFLWYNVGARVGLCWAVLLGFFCYLTLGGRMTLNQLEQHAQRIDAKVLMRKGTNGFDKNKALIVHVVPTDGSETRDIKIDEYLSADNWKAAKPGDMVRVWYLPRKAVAYLEDDILRNIQDEKGAWMGGWGFPLLLFCIGAPLALFLGRFRAGTHLDGREYLLRGDRVVLDGKSLPFSPVQLLAARGIIRILE